MKICYFIQNHLGPPQVRRLLAALARSPSEPFVLIAHDAFAGRCSVEELRRAVEVPVFAAREPARRGYFSIVQPYFDAVGWLAEHGVAYDWLVYLSAQDYPTRSLASFEAHLGATDCDGFLRFWRADAAANPWKRRYQGVLRYHLQYHDAPRWTAPALRLLRFVNRLQRRVHVHLVYGPRVGLGLRRPPFEEEAPCYAGTQWTTLRRACAEYVAEQVAGDRGVVPWFRRTICPCEAVVQTLLVNSGRFRLGDDDLRYVDFSGSRDGHPRTLTTADLDALTAGSHFFARKFDLARDRRVLDLLDERVARVLVTPPRRGSLPPGAGAGAASRPPGPPPPAPRR